MIVKVIYGDEGSFGHSFKGGVRYVAYDADRKRTQERIDFIAVRNLPSEDPEVCWRLMASHALQRQDLMRKAGLKPRSSGKGEVAHIVLSWTKQERHFLTKAEMLRAADGALRYLKLDKNQCFMAAHNDTEENPHIHLIASRVDLETGKLVSSWRSHKALSRWALDYERARGRVVVAQRERNWLARDNGIIPPKAKKTTSKDQYELEKAEERIYEARRQVALLRRVTLDRQKRAELRASGTVLRAQHHAAQRAVTDRIKLIQKHAAVRQQSAEQQERLNEQHHLRTTSIKTWAKETKRVTKRRIERAVDRRLAAIQERHAQELESFDENERSNVGRLYNRFAYTDWKQAVASRLSDEHGTSFLSTVFMAIGDAGHRRASLLVSQQAAVRQLYENASKMRKRRELRVDRQASGRLREARIRYGQALRLFDQLRESRTQQMKDEWKAFNRVRRGVAHSASEAAKQSRALGREFPTPFENARDLFHHKRVDVSDGKSEDKGGSVTAANGRLRRVRRPRMLRSNQRRRRLG